MIHPEEAPVSDASAQPWRRERSERTRQQVLDAAVEALVEHGYAGATTLRIQELAGMSRGRLLHQFPSRDLLLVAAVGHLATARFEALRARSDWPEDLAERCDVAVATMWSTYQQDYFWAATELWLAARHATDLRAALLPSERRLGEQVREATDEMFGPVLCARDGYPQVRELVNTSMRGVALTYAFDRRAAATDPHLAHWRRLARTALVAPRRPDLT